MNPGDVHWVELPPADGREQAGRRPAIVVQDDSFAGGSPLVLVVPLTSADAARRFPAVMAVAATSENGLSQDSFALVFQLRALDRRRFRERLGAVEPDILASIYAALDQLMGRACTP
jgi:mRNA interferase MazF